MTDKDKRLKTLRIKRGTFKTQITLFKNYLNKLDKNKLNNTDIQNLECRISKIEPIYTDFNQIQGEIESILDDDQDALTQAILEREQFDDYYFETLSLANGFLVISNDLVVQSQASNTVPNMQVKLPTIKLPTFDGNYTFWNEYRDSFETLIGNNNQLSNVHKLTYLKSSLINEPAELVRSFETISQNYQLAWDALQKKYNNKRRIITTHVQLLLDVPKINKESHSCLRLLINQVENHTQCLKALGQPIEEWDALIIPIITSKLDFQTNKEWELKLNSEPDSFTRLPTLTELLTFLNNKQNTLQTIYKGDKDFDKPKTQSNKIIRSFATANITCVFCNKDHNIHSCDIFNKLNENERNSKVRELKLCINCLRKGHFVNNCISKNTCKICHKGHHTLLHKTNQKKENDHARVAVGSDETVVTCSSEVKESSSQVLLSTALVHAQNNQGQLIEIRALLDSASQSNFISEGICEKLKLNKCPINTTVTGISNGLTKITHKVQVKIKSLHNNYTTVVSCLVLPKITTCLPSQSFNKELIKIPSNIVLADPLFNRSGNIDMLLGASIFYELLCIGQIREKNNPILQKTKFGWVISGNLYKQYVNQRPTQAFLTLNELNESVERFWKAEEISTQEQLLTPEEKYCENYFAETTTRDSSGRFNVRIPFKTNINQLGDSRQLAENRFHKLEKRFERDPDYKGMYEEFINEYIQLDHMTKIPPDNKRSFFLPHHAVIKESSETTKLRVVFDGSCKLNNGLALNETQCVGPTIQQELFTIIVRFRTYNYVLTADIAKMYRQIIIHSEDRSYQRILWRSQPTIELEQYELKTVTYGTTAAPFLAIRALYQLGLDNETLFPKEAEVIKGDFYVDDMLTGTNTIDELKVVKANVDKILKTAGFNLRKWTSNVRELCDKELVNSNESSLNENLHKTLGIYWNPNTDEFTYATEIKFQTQITKRTILATSAQLFDPLGLLSPIIIMSKFILQELWQHKIDWDEPVPAILQEK